MTDANTRCKDFKVAIVGGGMCGLAVAVGLAKGGIDVEIYEAAVIALFEYLCRGLYPLTVSLWRSRRRSRFWFVVFIDRTSGWLTSDCFL